jgi:hypothetical protein
MVEIKTKPTDEDVISFLNTVENPKRKSDGLELLEIMKELTDEKPTMWGTSIIGFGTIHYKYKTGREIDWFKTGFSPRKRNLTVYLGVSLDEYSDLLERLGKHKTGKGCVYINKLSDVNIDVLKEILRKSMDLPDVFTQ